MIQEIFCLDAVSFLNIYYSLLNKGDQLLLNVLVFSFFPLV